MVTIENIYTKYGEVCHVAHLLETEIGTICAMNHVVMNKEGYEKIDSSERLKKVHKNTYRKTLGQLLGDIVDVINDQNTVDTIFKLAHTERNRLIHDFYYDYREQIESEGGREAMMQDLSKILKIIADALSIANDISEKLMGLLIPVTRPTHPNSTKKKPRN